MKPAILVFLILFGCLLALPYVSNPELPPTVLDIPEEFCQLKPGDKVTITHSNDTIYLTIGGTSTISQ